MGISQAVAFAIGRVVWVVFGYAVLTGMVYTYNKALLSRRECAQCAIHSPGVFYIGIVFKYVLAVGHVNNRVFFVGGIVIIGQINTDSALTAQLRQFKIGDLYN